MSHKIVFCRLIESANINFDNGFCWDKHQIRLSDIKNAIDQNIVGTSDPYGDEWKHPVKAQKSKKYHLKRVLYFVQNPTEIKDIEVDNVCSDMVIYPNALVTDGWHRILAAYYLNLEYITIKYGGRMDVLNYLKGKRKTPPKQMI
jgi:hypothetical protein